MRQYTNISVIVALCVTLCFGDAYARGRNDRQNSHQQTEIKHKDRPGSGNRPGHSGRPGGKDNKGDKHKFDKRPGNRPGHGNKPSPGFRPQRPNDHQHGFRPQPPTHGNVNHGYHHVNHGRPHRPHMYPPRPYHRPTPPPRHWRPAHAWRPFNTILGITFGTAVNLSINALLNNGYSVAGYDNDAIYLSDVSMLNFSWPVAHLYYGNGGGLYGSEFIYSTPGYSLVRYNNVFNKLVAGYGSPYKVRQFNGGGREAVWWGNNGQYITLTFAGDYTGNGSLRYFTTLSFGR